MVDPWRSWDERLKDSMRPDRVAHELTDAELLVLLGCERSGNRRIEKEILKQELSSRLRARR